MAFTISGAKTDERFRILAVGRSGVGKSSLINRVLGIDIAVGIRHSGLTPTNRPLLQRVSHLEVGVSDIEREYVSPKNERFILHDSNGFEPGEFKNCQVVCDFLLRRSGPRVPPGDRVNAVWLCTETPPAGGRVFEKGDEILVKFAHEHQVPLVIVFTQYDRLERTKVAELEEDEGITDPEILKIRSDQDSQKAFERCLFLVRRTIEKYLKVPMPRYCSISVRPRYPAKVQNLVNVTLDILVNGMNQPGPHVR